MNYNYIIFIPEHHNLTGGVTRQLYDIIKGTEKLNTYTPVWVVSTAANLEKMKMLFPKDIVIRAEAKIFKYFLHVAPLIIAEDDFSAIYTYSQDHSIVQIANCRFVQKNHNCNISSKILCGIGDSQFIYHLYELGVNRTKLFVYDYSQLNTEAPYNNFEIQDPKNNPINYRNASSASCNITDTADKEVTDIIDNDDNIYEYNVNSNVYETVPHDITLLSNSVLSTISGSNLSIGVSTHYKNSDDEYRFNDIFYTDHDDNLPYWVHFAQKEIHVLSEETSLAMCMKNKIVYYDETIDFISFTQKQFEKTILNELVQASQLSKLLFIYKQEIKGLPIRLLRKSKTQVKKSIKFAKKGIKAIGKPVKQVIKQILYSVEYTVNRKSLTKINNTSNLIHYKNLYKGKRCFLIGNGPSLRTEDLEILHKNGEITFGCNKVYKTFNQTQWRPTYLCMIDALIAKYQSHELHTNIECPVFTNATTLRLMDYKPQQFVIANNIGKKEYKVSRNFGAYYYPSGATVMSFMLELAMYMGFDTIYLLGVDCTSSLDIKGHAQSGYFNNSLVQKDIERVKKRLHNPNLTADDVAEYYYNKSTYSYALIKEYADMHNYHVYNATRGGQLEVFERKDFDSLFNN